MSSFTNNVVCESNEQELNSASCCAAARYSVPMINDVVDDGKNGGIKVAACLSSSL